MSGLVPGCSLVITLLIRRVLFGFSNINANARLHLTFAGILPCQYMTFSVFAGMGEVRQ